MRSGFWSRAALALGAIIVAATPAVPQSTGRLTALAPLKPGRWQIREIGGTGQPRALCVGDVNLLTQIEHRRSPCSRLVIENQPRRATVHYTCPADGFGRTTLRVDSSNVVRIDTQGILDNRPFAYRAEARRTGSCR